MLRSTFILFCAIFFLLCFIPLLAIAYSPTMQISEVDVQYDLRWELLENNAKSNNFHTAQFILINRSKEPISGKWSLYFNSIYFSINATSNTEHIELRHLSGDFYRIRPTQSVHIGAGDSLQIQYTSPNYLLKNSHIPKSPYLVLENNSEPILPNTYKKARIVLNDHIEQFKGASRAHLLPTAEILFEANKNLTLLPKDELSPILPMPKDISVYSDSLSIELPFTIESDGQFTSETRLFVHQIKSQFGEMGIPAQPSEKALIQVLFDASIKSDEGYELKINSEGVRIKASSAPGAWYGLQSLFALLQNELSGSKNNSSTVKLPYVDIEDEPRFELRGQFLDISRNFQQKKDILRLIDLLSFYKFNTLQLHLANDEAWRIEIKGLPELTEFGSKRGHSENESNLLWPYYGSGPFADKSPYGSGYLSREDFIEILQYAHDRHIEVIPEIVTPGHMKAAILAMEVRYKKYLDEGKKTEAEKYRLIHPNDASEYISVQRYRKNTIDVCLESSFQFYEKVVDEMLSMYKDAGVPIHTFHSGGDEVPRGVWEASPACEDLIANNSSIKSISDLHHYFYSRLSDLFSERGLQMAGWEEVGQKLEKKNGILVHVADSNLVDKGFRLHAWNAVVGWGGTDMAYRLANMGYEVVLSNSSNLYFDLAYDMDPNEPGLHWSGFVNLRSAWQMTPFNHFISNQYDINGNRIDANTLANSHQSLTEKGKTNIVGLQGQLWSETVNGPDMMYYYLLPKLLGLAERAWSPQAEWANITDESERNQKMEKDWNQFANRIGQFEFNRLSQLFSGYTVRLPKPGLIILDGMIYANVENPGLSIRYTLDGSEPTRESTLYTQPINLGNNTVIKARTFGAKGQVSGTTSITMKGEGL